MIIDIGHYVSEFISEIECYKIEETFYESTDVILTDTNSQHISHYSLIYYNNDTMSIRYWFVSLIKNILSDTKPKKKFFRIFRYIPKMSGKTFLNISTASGIIIL